MVRRPSTRGQGSFSIGHRGESSFEPLCRDAHHRRAAESDAARALGMSTTHSSGTPCRAYSAFFRPVSYLQRRVAHLDGEQDVAAEIARRLGSSPLSRVKQERSRVGARHSRPAGRARWQRTIARCPTVRISNSLSSIHGRHVRFSNRWHVDDLSVDQFDPRFRLELAYLRPCGSTRRP